MPRFTDTHPDCNEPYIALLDNLDQPDEFELSNWECDFLDAMMKQCESTGTLTDAQATKLREIATKYLS